jgi:hypothetical protein
MAVDPVFMGEREIFRENAEIGLIWFYLVYFGKCFPIVSPLVSPNIYN